GPSRLAGNRLGRSATGRPLQKHGPGHQLAVDRRSVHQPAEPRRVGPGRGSVPARRALGSDPERLLPDGGRRRPLAESLRRKLHRRSRHRTAQSSGQRSGGPGVLYVVNGQRLLASTDGGRTWTILYDANGTGAIERFAAHPAAPRVLYLAVLANPSVLLQSVDGGQTWAPVTSSPSEVQDIVLAPGAVYIAVRGQEPGILRSTDQGRTWRPVLGGTPSRQFDVHSVTRS